MYRIQILPISSNLPELHGEFIQPGKSGMSFFHLMSIRNGKAGANVRRCLS